MMIDLIGKALDTWEDVGKAVYTGPPQYTFQEIGALARLDETWARLTAEHPPIATIHLHSESSGILTAAWAALETYSARGRWPPERPPELD